MNPVNPPAVRRQPTSRVAAIVALATVAVAGLGGWATEIGPWYLSLRQPPWKPPDWLFGPVWTTIYSLTAWSVVRQWQAATVMPQRRQVLAAALVNAALNVAWSVLFFKLRRPDWAAAQVALLWLSVLAMMRVAARIDPRSAWLLLPYLLWVAFAAALNFAVVSLNSS